MNTHDPLPPGIIRRWTLQLDSLDDLKPKLVDRDDIDVRRVEVPLPQFNRFLQETVGADFRWDGRASWSSEDWQEFVDRPELETWVLYVRGTPAGFFETEHFDDDSARIHSFGLLNFAFGQGLGAHLLSFAANRAFDRGAHRVWLRTCTKDHYHALPNYKARGFRIIREEDLRPQD